MIKALIKTLVKAWDPDYTKVTASEKELLDKADAEMKMGKYISEKEIYAQLAESRAYYERGEYEDFDDALDDISKKYGL